MSTRADNVLAGFKEGRVARDHFHTNLEKLLSTLPTNIVNDVAEVSQSFTDYLGSAISEDNMPEIPKHFVIMKYGLLPSDCLRKDVRNIHSPEWLTRTLDDPALAEFSLGTRFYMHITLLPNGRLPDFKLVNLFLHRHGTPSDLVEVAGIYDRTLIKYFTRSLYKALSDGTVKYLKDTSEKIWDDVATDLVLGYIKEKAAHLLPKDMIEPTIVENISIH